MRSTRRRFDVGDDIRDTGLLKTPTCVHLRGGEALRDEETRPRLVVVVFGLGVVRKDAGDDVGCCRSSDELGVIARRHGKRCGAVLWAPGDTASAVKCSVAAIGVGGHGGDMAGRR